MSLFDVLFGPVVVPPEGEHRVGCGADERGVDDVSHAGGRGGVDERAVLVEPVSTLDADTMNSVSAPSKAAADARASE
jgi:hypothetical protein